VLARLARLAAAQFRAPLEVGERLMRIRHG